MVQILTFNYLTATHWLNDLEKFVSPKTNLRTRNPLGLKILRHDANLLPDVQKKGGDCLIYTPKIVAQGYPKASGSKSRISLTPYFLPFPPVDFRQMKRSG